MDSDEIYYYRRAQKELEMAQASTLLEATLAHYQLATRYLDLVYDTHDAAKGTEQALKSKGAYSQIVPNTD